jgi:hypothetical protein
VGGEASATRQSWIRWLKRAFLGLGALVVAGIATVIAIVTNHSTYCYAIFDSSQAAARVEALGLEDADRFRIGNAWGIEFTSGETGDDAQVFRRTVKALVKSRGGHLEKNTPCIERPFFD